MAYEVTLPDVEPPQASGSSTEGATPLTPHQETLPQFELETEEKAPKDTVWVLFLVIQLHTYFDFIGTWEQV